MFSYKFLGNNETSTPKDQSLVELKPFDSPIVTHKMLKKYPSSAQVKVGNELVKSPRKPVTQADKSNSSPHKMIITKPKLPEKLKTPRTSDESLTPVTENSKTDNLTAMLDRIISQGDMKNKKDAEKKAKNDTNQRGEPNQYENKIERETTNFREKTQMEQRIESGLKNEPQEEQSIAVMMFETFGQPLIWSANDEIKEKDDEEEEEGNLWQSPEEEANQAAKYAEIARQNAIKERAERKMEEERARAKAIEEAAMKSPFMLRRRAGAYGIKQLTKYTKD